MPIWGAFFLLRLHKAPFVLVDFTRHGELGLYAAAFLAPSVYQILKSIRRDDFPLRGGSVLLALVGILMAAFLYAGTNPQLGANASMGTGTVDEPYLMQVSGILLLLAFGFSFLVTLIDISVNDPDLGVTDKVEQGFLNAAVAVESPRGVQGVAPPDHDDNTTPLNDELKRKFNADRAGEDSDG